jgi:hypothetical protein
VIGLLLRALRHLDSWAAGMSAHVVPTALTYAHCPACCRPDCAKTHRDPCFHSVCHRQEF